MPVRHRLATYAAEVIRLLGVLALAAPLAIGTLFLLMPDLAESLVDSQTRLVVASVAAAIAGVTMTAAVLYLHSQVKLRAPRQGDGTPRASATTR